MKNIKPHKPNQPAASAAGKIPVSFRKKLGTGVLFAVAALAIYFNAIPGEFIWDDINLIPNNAYIRGNAPVARFFTESIRAGAGDKLDDFYRPMQMVSYWLDYKVWQLDVRGYHITNIILHAAVAYALFFFLLKLGQNFYVSFVASLLFLVHPAHSEAVAYISGRADLLVALFLLLACLCFNRYEASRHPGALGGTVAFYVLGLLSKEYMLIFLAGMAAYPVLFRRKNNWLLLGLLSLVTVGYLFIRFKLISTVLPPEFTPPPFLERIPGIFVSLLGYIRVLLWPLDLHMEYGGKVFEYFYYKSIIGMIAAAVIGLVCWKIKIKNAFLRGALLWGIIMFLPNSNLIPLNAYMAEHWLYIPSMGWFAILGLMFEKIRTWFGNKTRMTGAVIVVLVLFYAILTVKQSRVWRDADTLYTHTLKYAPDSARVMSNLGIVKFRKGEKSEAERLFKTAIETDPRYYNAYLNLGNVYREAKRLDEAKVLYEKVLEISGGDAGVYNNLGNVLFDLGDLGGAEKYYSKSIEINPYHAMSYNNIGLVAMKRGDDGKAEKMFQRAVQIDPHYADPYYSLAIICYNRGDYANAIQFCDRAISLGYAGDQLRAALAPYRKR